MPDRTTPLRSTTGLTRSWWDRQNRTVTPPLESADTPGPDSSGPSTRRLARWRHPARSRAERAAKRLVRARSQGYCELRLPGCAGIALDFSHRIAAGRGGTWTASNGCAACRRCHEAITNTQGRRQIYEALGFLVATGADTTRVPVRIPRRGFVLLTDDGHYLDIPDLEAT